MLVLLLWLILSVCAAIRLNSNIVYNPVSYPKNNFNLTIGTLYDSPTSGAIDYRYINLFGKMCAMYKYNTGSGQFKTGGTLYLEGSNTVYNDTNTYYEAMQLLQTTLSSKNVTIQDEIKTRYPNPVGSFIGASGFASFYSVSPYFDAFVIPSLSYADATQTPDSGAVKSIAISSPTFATFSINPSVTPGLFNVINQFFVQMNWSFVGVIFGNSTFGQIGEIYVEGNDYNGRVKQNVIYTCSTSLTNDPNFFEIQMETFKACVNKLDTVSVVLLWMSIQDGLRVKQYLDSIGADNLTYVLAYIGSDRGNTTFGDPEKYFDLSFYVQPYVSRAVLKEVDDCFSLATPGEFNTTNPYSIRDIINELIICDINNNTQIPVCTNFLEDREKEKCRCVFLVETNYYNLTVIILFLVHSHCL